MMNFGSANRGSTARVQFLAEANGLCKIKMIKSLKMMT